MKNALIPVAIVTAVLIIYTVLASAARASGLVTIIFMFSPFLIVWMVISVLKSKETSDRTFDEYFYDDADIRRGSSK
ncbi:MAG: hypothetical protein ACHQD9_02060 [Chitinophagales bacterium]